jgi:uncharacterized protein
MAVSAPRADLPGRGVFSHPCTGAAVPANESDPLEHAELVAGLVRHLAAASPDEPPQVVQTHISTIILSGDCAYKLKKPVRLPFLDFSTLARRRFFCEEEWRLNRRTAPQLYLDVQPVTGRVDAPVIGGPGEPIDWLLRMRRFGREGEFRALALSGQLQPAHIDGLASHLAAFHQGLPPVALADVPARDAWHWAAASLDEIAADPQRPASCSPQDVAALRTALGRLFARHADLVAQRGASGLVREAHGDLHLGNIVLWQGQVLAFDAIEFDPALRRIDLMNDVAFTFMDLLALGLPALAWRFINAYIERTGDYEGLVLLQAFAAGRAIVRAKVALLSGGDAAAFGLYWPLAVRLAQPLGTARLVLTMGLSGSGKSTVAQYLAEQLGAVRVRSDVERKRLHGLSSTERPHPGSALQASLYAREATERTYAHLGALAQTLLVAGVTVIVDAAFLRHDERAVLRELASRQGVPFVLVHCIAPEAVLKARIETRIQAGTDPSDATATVLALQQSVQEPLPDHWAPWVHTLVNDGSLDDLRCGVAALVAQWTMA